MPAALSAAVAVAATATALAVAPADRAEHVVLGLTDNRTLAHGIRAGGLVVTGAAPGFVKYTRFGKPSLPWRLGLTEGGRRVAASTVPQVALALPLSAEQAQRATALVLRVEAPAAGALRVALNGRAAPPTRLGPGWQTATVALPPGAARAGENDLVLIAGAMGPLAGARGGLALDWLALGGAEPPAAEATVAVATPTGFPLAPGGGVAFYLAPTAGTRLRPGAIAGASGPCALRVRVLREGGARAEALVQPAALARARIDLGGADGQAQRVELVGEGRCDGAELRDAALIRAGVEPTVDRTHRPRNVLFWLTDSLRADRVKLYNPKARAEVPTYERLAREGVVFRQHYVQGNESRASHASLWSGIYPSVHRVLTHGARLATQLVTLPEALRATNLHTFCRTANGYITTKGGFGEGWDVLKNHIHEGGGVTAEDFPPHVAAFLKEGRGDKPFFLFLGTVDNHVSWRARRPWIDRYDPGPYAGPFKDGFMGPQLEAYLAGKLKLGDRDKQRALALYDSQCSYNDRAFGQVLDLLAAAGKLDETLVVTTSDHGDEFWEHGRIGHGAGVHEELVAVPLLMRMPGLLRGGTVVDEGVELIDVLPTVLDALGAPIPDEVQGESLLPLAQGVGAGYPRPSLATHYELAHAMRLGRYKLWVSGGNPSVLTDLWTDRLERRDASLEQPTARRLLEDAFSLWLVYQKRWKKRRWGVATRHLPGLAADLERDPTPAR